MGQGTNDWVSIENASSQPPLENTNDPSPPVQFIDIIRSLESMVNENHGEESVLLQEYTGNLFEFLYNEVESEQSFQNQAMNRVSHPPPLPTPPSMTSAGPVLGIPVH